MRTKLEQRTFPRLHHPGRIIHLRAIGSGKFIIFALF